MVGHDLSLSAHRTGRLFRLPCTERVAPIRQDVVPLAAQVSKRRTRKKESRMCVIHGVTGADLIDLEQSSRSHGPGPGCTWKGRWTAAKLSPLSSPAVRGSSVLR